MLNLPAYLERIAYTGPLLPTSATLRELHRCHMFTVPFENLDIALGRRIVCEPEAFIRKIVERRRGGFCYELNGAFAQMLRAIGFKVTLLSARVSRDDGTESPEYDHLALRVDLAEPWLADVGFGDSFLEPLRLEMEKDQLQDGRRFRIMKDRESPQPDSLVMERTEPDGAWKRQYSFTLAPRMLEEFAATCLYHQISPESPFTRRSVCTKPTSYGRVTLSDQKLVFTRRGSKEEKLLETDDERRAALKEHFGITL